MVWSLLIEKRRRKLVEDAARSRASRVRMTAAWIVVIVYNLVGFTDIYSTILAIDSGMGVEANPIIRTAMDHVGDGWVYAKLGLQGVITCMVLWFPHWFVVGMFTLATAGNAFIVYNNLSIAGVF